MKNVVFALLSVFVLTTTLQATECDLFKRGDANCDGNVNLSDAVYIMEYLFNGGPLPCNMDAADTSDDGGVGANDAVYITNYLFLAGSPPPPPFECYGIDPTPDDLEECCDQQPGGSDDTNSNGFEFTNGSPPWDGILPGIYEGWDTCLLIKDILCDNNAGCAATNIGFEIPVADDWCVGTKAAFASEAVLLDVYFNWKIVANAQGRCDPCYPYGDPNHLKFDTTDAKVICEFTGGGGSQSIEIPVSIDPVGIDIKHEWQESGGGGDWVCALTTVSNPDHVTADTYENTFNLADYIGQLSFDDCEDIALTDITLIYGDAYYQVISQNGELSQEEKITLLLDSFSVGISHDCCEAP